MRIVSAGLIGAALFLGGCQEKKPDVVHEERMTLDQVPPKVRQALNRESEVPVESINRHEVNGNVVFEATVQSGRKSYDVELDPDGRLLRRSARPTTP
jgi:hypothetical protein